LDKKRITNKSGINQYSQTIVADYYDKKGHPLRPVWFRKPKGHSGSIRIPDVMYCPKCNLFFRLGVEPIKVKI